MQDDFEKDGQSRWQPPEKRLRDYAEQKKEEAAAAERDKKLIVAAEEGLGWSQTQAPDYEAKKRRDREEREERMAKNKKKREAEEKKKEEEKRKKELTEKEAPTSSFYGAPPPSSSTNKATNPLKASTSKAMTQIKVKKDSKRRMIAEDSSDEEGGVKEVTKKKVYDLTKAKDATGKGKGPAVVDLASDCDSSSPASSQTRKRSTSSNESLQTKKKKKALQPSNSEINASTGVGDLIEAGYREELEKKRRLRDAKRARREEKRRKGLSSGSDADDSDVSSIASVVEIDDGFSEDEFRRLEIAEKERLERGGTPDALLASDDLKSYLLSLPHAKPNPTHKNPKGVRLPLVETASFCRRHEEENTVIPEGQGKGWPKEIKWQELDKRIRQQSDALIGIITGTRESAFKEEAKAEWERKGARKMGNIMSEWGSFDVEQPGYYGPRGFEVFMASLRKRFVDLDAPLLTPDAAKPLEVSAYLRRVLVPEVTVALIAQDLSCDREEATKVRQESSAYGKAMFASSEEERDFGRAEERREEREEEERRRKRKKVEQERRREEEKKEARAVTVVGDSDSDEAPAPASSRQPKTKATSSKPLLTKSKASASGSRKERRQSEDIGSPEPKTRAAKPGTKRAKVAEAKARKKKEEDEKKARYKREAQAIISDLDSSSDSD
ncbi:hypothetical protein MNV49_005726 [Pseudohyphozyma bogoriensis]|nr:hypothetical protein MNV49_005726 [Pseudohyphozyma bogoriensis]